MWLAVMQRMQRQAMQFDAGLQLILILLGYSDTPMHATAMQHSCLEVEQVGTILTCDHEMHMLLKTQAAPMTWASSRFMPPPLSFAPFSSCFPFLPAHNPLHRLRIRNTICPGCCKLMQLEHRCFQHNLVSDKSFDMLLSVCMAV